MLHVRTKQEKEQILIIYAYILKKKKKVFISCIFYIKYTYTHSADM